MKHFKITENTKVNYFGITLYQVQLTTDCIWGQVGDLGGWVESEDNLQDHAWIGGDAEVFGNAVVSGRAGVFNNASISKNARVCGDARVGGNAIVSGNAQVFGDAMVYDTAEVLGNAEVCGNAIIHTSTRINGGVWDKTPFQIIGTKYYVRESNKGYLTIETIEKPTVEWQKTLEEYAKEEGFTDKEIAEYKAYIELVIKLQEIKEM